MEYLSIKQTSEKWGISVRRIQVLCSKNRIPGATKIGSYWAIPADAEKPNTQPQTADNNVLLNFIFKISISIDMIKIQRLC